MDPLDLWGGDITDGGVAAPDYSGTDTSQVDPSVNPSVDQSGGGNAAGSGSDWLTGLIQTGGLLINDATRAYQTNQMAGASIAASQAQGAAYAQPGLVLPAIFGAPGGTSHWLIIGAGILLFALVLRR